MADIGNISGLAPLLGMALSLVIFLSIGLYVYVALAWMTIAKKLNYDKPWLAWIPIANFFLFPILAGKRWTWGFILFAPIANLVFMIIWWWKIYELRGYPGALSLIMLGSFLPFIGGFAGVAHLVVLGIVAWGKGKGPAVKK